MKTALSNVFSESKAERQLIELQCALDVESFWRASLRLLENAIPHHSCSLMLHVVDYQPKDARHHMDPVRGGGFQPVTSLSIARPFLATHPQVKLYTYSEIVEQDPRAHQRRQLREKQFLGWNQFVHLAFWEGDRPDAVLSVRRGPGHGDFSPAEKDFLTRLHPIIDDRLRRLRVIERERGRIACIESFLSSVPLPVMLLDANGQLGFATQEGYDLCAAWNFGFSEARVLNTRRCFRVPPEVMSACDRLAASRDSSAAGFESERVVHQKISRLTARIEICQPIKGPYVRHGFWVTFRCEQNLDGTLVELRQEALNLLQGLTPSERRVALLVAEGCRNQVVALRLGKSSRTVELQLTSIFKKLDISSRTELSHLLS